MKVVQQGDTVELHYTTYAADGCVIETSGQRDPLQFVAGSADIITGINRAVIGMRLGERRRIAVSPEQAFGFRDPRLTQITPRLGLLEKVDEGDQLTASIQGTELDIWVRSITGNEISLDANHPLAGESLVYEIEVVGVTTSGRDE
jgi:peptidylprolyl isomerase